MPSSMDKGEHQRRTKSVLLSSTKRKGLSQRVQMLTQEVKQLWAAQRPEVLWVGQRKKSFEAETEENFLFKEATKGEA